MSATAGRVASKVGSTATKAVGKAAESGKAGQQGVLQKGAKRDPELYVRRYPTSRFFYEAQVDFEVRSS